jgi:TonB family protein
MALRERFGRLVLLEETDADSLGREYRAARLGPAGLDRLVGVQRFGPSLTADPDAAKRLMDQVRSFSRLQNPGLVRLLGIGRVDQSYYVSSELVEGRTLKSILGRCRQESFPFSADHALMVASRSASALEYVHGKKDGGGAALFHGLLTPARIVVAFDGEIKLKGLGLWPSLRGTDVLGPEERRYLAPEQASGGPGDARSDIYALGLILLEALTGRPPGEGDPVPGLTALRLTSAAGEEAPLPGPLAGILRRALAGDPSSRFESVSEARKEIDTLLFSGDFTPTTFDLAFFMHTLFREDIERELLALEEARHADYREFLVEDKSRAEAVPSGSAPSPAETPSPAMPAEASATTAAEAGSRAEPVLAPPPTPSPVETRAPEAPAQAREGASRATRESAAREAASRLTFHRHAAPIGRRRWLWVLGGLLMAAVLAGGGGYVYLLKFRPRSSPAAPTAAEQAAAARVRELEQRIATLEREKAEAEARAAEDARQKLEAQAAASGRAVDPTAVVRAQEDARRRARAEQERRQQEEMSRLAEQKKAEQRREEEARAAAEAAAAVTPSPAPTSTPPPTPAPTPSATPSASPTPTAEPAASTAPALLPGTLVDAAEPGVTAPVLVHDNPVAYPRLALDRRVEASVLVRALIDEKGSVTEVTVVGPSGRPQVFGFEDAAVKCVKGRVYRPAMKDGVPVKIRISVRIVFKLPKP